MRPAHALHASGNPIAEVPVVPRGFDKHERNGQAPGGPRVRMGAGDSYTLASGPM
jgi:hypothetical protein